MTNDELVALGVWVLETVGEAPEAAMSYGALDTQAVAAGIVPKGVISPH